MYYTSDIIVWRAVKHEISNFENVVIVRAMCSLFFPTGNASLRNTN